MPNEKKSKLLSESDLFATLTDVEKVLFVLWDHPNINKKGIAKCCYDVKTVKTVKPVNNINDINNINTLTTLRNSKKKLNSLAVLLNRELDKENILVNKSVIPNTYKLSDNGKIRVKTIWNRYETELEKVLIRDKDKELFHYTMDGLSEYFNKEDIKIKILRRIGEGNKFFTLNLMTLAQYDTTLTDQIIENPERATDILRIVIDKCEYIEKKDFCILFSGLPKDCYHRITDIRTPQLNRLISFVCEIRSRSTTMIQTVSNVYTCPTCSNTIKKYELEQEIEPPTFCPQCQTKKKFKVVTPEYVDTLRITGNDLYEHLTNNEVQEEINIMFRGDYFNFSTLREGDKIRIVGIPQVIHNVNRRGKKSIYQKKIVLCVGLEKLEQDYSKVLIQDSDKLKIAEVRKAPVEWFEKNVFSDLHNVSLGIRAGLLSLFGHINTLHVGVKGSGKTEITDRLTRLALRGAFTDAYATSQSGVLGTLTKNEFTNRFTLDGGVFRRMHPGGIVGIDELNRDEKFKLQNTLLGIMSRRKLTITKANTRINEDCDLSIMATANPLPTNYEKGQGYNHFQILDVLWDRFDLIIYYSNKLDFDNEDLLMSLMLNHKRKFKVVHDIMNTIKKYQIRASLIKPKLSDQDKKRLVKVLKFYVEKIDPKASYRRVGSMGVLLIAICKMNLREKPIRQDFIFLTDLIKDIMLSKSEYIKLCNDEIKVKEELIY